MKLYPPFKVTRVKISNPNDFYVELRKIIGHGNTILEGYITDNGFLAEINCFHSNPGRPLIRGKFEIENNNHYLLIDLKVKMIPIYFVGTVVALIIIMGIVTMSFYAIPMCLFTIVFFYFSTWFSFAIDLPQTKEEVSKIVKMAAANNI